jgi:hypothetical protein
VLARPSTAGAVRRLNAEAEFACAAVVASIMEEAAAITASFLNMFRPLMKRCDFVSATLNRE